MHCLSFAFIFVQVHNSVLYVGISCLVKFVSRFLELLIVTVLSTFFRIRFHQFCFSSIYFSSFLTYHVQPLFTCTITHTIDDPKQIGETGITNESTTGRTYVTCMRSSIFTWNVCWISRKVQDVSDVCTSIISLCLLQGSAKAVLLFSQYSLFYIAFYVCDFHNHNSEIIHHLQFNTAHYKFLLCTHLRNTCSIKSTFFCHSRLGYEPVLASIHPFLGPMSLCPVKCKSLYF
jgi:hypothetical protein